MRAARAALAARGSPDRAAGAKAYLKSELEFLGVDAGGLRATAREIVDRHRELDHDQLTALVRALWEEPVFELKALGVALLELRPGLLGADDLGLIEELVRRSGTWALVDWICTKVAAPVVLRAPAAAKVLERWSRDDDFWLRRAALLAQLPELRAGRGDFGLFARLAERMVEDREFFIRKAIGWVLRDVSRKRPELAFAFLAAHIDRVSGLTLREGSKHLTESQKRKLAQMRSGGRG
ncbi:MAG: DNA alkylation repair protein [Holophagae bacterium]|nr:MAG: DNA alkylation repair protein [Holophagae bacterium]